MLPNDLCVFDEQVSICQEIIKIGEQLINLPYSVCKSIRQTSNTLWHTDIEYLHTDSLYLLNLPLNVTCKALTNVRVYAE